MLRICGGNSSIPEEYEVAPEGPGRRVRPRPTHIHEDPPVIPIEDELPMDPYNFELRAYQDDIGCGLNQTNMTLSIL